MRVHGFFFSSLRAFIDYNESCYHTLTASLLSLGSDSRFDRVLVLRAHTDCCEVFISWSCSIIAEDKAILLGSLSSPRYELLAHGTQQYPPYWHSPKRSRPTSKPPIMHLCRGIQFLHSSLVQPLCSSLSTPHYSYMLVPSNIDTEKNKY
jgi:hypothetical protein